MTYNDFDVLILAWSQAQEVQKFPNFWVNALFEWQTLIAAIVAGVPAAVGAYLLWKQIRIQQNENARIRSKEETSARIRLAAAMAALTQHYKTCIMSIIRGKYDNHVVPTSSLETLMASAPTVDPLIFEHIQRLILDFQIFSSRFPSKVGVLPRDLQEILLSDLAKLHLATEALYPFARFRSESVDVAPFTKEAMRNSLNHLLTASDLGGVDADDEATVKRALAKAFPPRTTREIPVDDD